MTNIIVKDVLVYKNSEKIDLIYSSIIERKNFRSFCSIFRICLVNLNALEYIKTPILFLKVYSEEMQKDKLNFIDMIYAQNEDLRKQRLINFLYEKLYSFTRDEVETIGRRCPKCVARNLINTRPVILTIRGFFIKKRYLFDLIDLRHYSMINNNYNWMLMGVNSFSKFTWATPLKNKSKSTTALLLETFF
ncbi:hypothetical protein CDIK_3459 [Cucumispora dikerogammari]|nr:hypothetical protein CDIK_3459 [Cucumispora dikerogammari]